MAAEIDGVPAIDRLKDHYKHCIRLSASNKINPKNAFDLQLIDYMQDLVSTTEDGQMNFKIASSALDVGAKIYSNRVDRIQSEAQKVASSILMALDGQQKDHRDPNDTQTDGANDSANSDGLNDSGDLEQNGRAKQKKKRTTRNKNVKTVMADETQLDAKLEKMVLGDAFLDGLSQDYDMSCPAALISYNALTQPTCLLTIESANLRGDYREVAPPKLGSRKSELPTIVEEADDETDCDATMAEQTSNAFSSNQLNNQYNFVTLITKNTNCAQIIRDNENNHICPRLENFLFNDRTTSISGLNSNLDDSKMASNDDQINLSSSKPSGGAHEFNPELYSDHGDDHFGDADSFGGDDENQPGDRPHNDLPDLDKIACSQPTDYGYSTEHHRLLNTWAGPHAWKALKAPATAKKDGAPKSTRKRAKTEQKPINFEEEFETHLEEIADKDIRHSADVIRRWKKPLLPQDHNLNEESIRATLKHTFLRPEDTYHCMKTPADALKLVDADHDYTKTNENGDVDDCPASPGMGGFDDVHDDSDDEFRADPVVDGNEVAIYGAPINNTLAQNDLEFAGEHLIEQPYTVAQVNIPFAKIAKKMDVRKLKRVMWDLLLPPERRLDLEQQQTNGVGGDASNQTIIENIATPETTNHEVSGNASELNQTVIHTGGDQNGLTIDGQPTKKTPSPTPSESAVHLEFSNLYGGLPVRVSSKMASDLSQPIAFVTLLHLANEKNLKLIPNQDLKDFIIEQDELV